MVSLVKSLEISVWNEMCERISGVFKLRQADRRDQELSKTFCGLKIGPLLRKLQAFKEWQFFDFCSQLKWCRNDENQSHGNHVVSTWKPHGVHVKTTWCPHGNNMLSICKTCSVHLGTMCYLHGNYIMSTWKPHGVHVDTTWFLHGHHVVSMWTQHSYHIDTTWFQGGHHMVSMWLPCTFHVHTMWFPGSHQNISNVDTI